jgi:hypothetical protein
VEESFWKRLWTCRLTDYWWWWALTAVVGPGLFTLRFPYSHFVRHSR